MADYSNLDTIAATGNIDPELEAHLKQTPWEATDWADLKKMRAARFVMEKARAPSAEEAKFQYPMKIKMRDGYESEIIVHRPENPPEKSPLIVLLYGGGFIVGSNVQLGPYARALAKIYGATAVTLSYRMAPEEKFPAAPNDTWDSVKWLAEHASDIGADCSAGFLLGGISAGGNLTAVIAQKALDEKLSPPLTGLWVAIPVLLNEQNVPEKYKHRWFSRKQNEKAPIFNMSAIENVDKYLQQDESSPDWSPFNLKHAFDGTPPTYIQVCGMDPLRDDGLIYEQVLRDHGVKTKMDVYPGQPHAHWSYLPQLEASKQATADTIVNFGWLLGVRPPSHEHVKASVAPPGGS